MLQTRNLVVAVDGGQSSTLAVVATAGGRILGSGLAGPSNHIHEPGGQARLENAMRQSIGQALTSAGSSADQVSHICVGTTSPALQETREVIQQMFPDSPIQAYYDMVTALAGASIARPGVVVIAGTGSVAYGRREDGREARAGGWGYLIGDEGSAYSIGRAALQMASQAVDGRGKATTLAQRVPAFFGLPDMAGVKQAIYTPAISRPQIAGLAATVTEAARGGDEVALALLGNAGESLAELALAVLAKLGALDAEFSVFTTGGVFRAGILILNPFRESLMARSNASVGPAEFGPIIGALFLALQAAGSALDDKLIQVVRDTLPATAIAKSQGEDSD